MHERIKPTNTKGVQYTYFSAGDPSLAFALDQRLFDHHLVHQTMLEPAPLWPDSFLFASPFISSSKLLPFVMEGLRRGAIVGAFRWKQGEFTDFTDYLRRLKQEDILGIRPDAGNIAARLNSVLNSGDFVMHHWGEGSVGKGFWGICQRYLMREAPPRRITPAFKRAWQDSLEWRNDVLLKAYEEDAKISEERGVRRSTIYRKMASTFGIDPERARTQQLSDLFGAARERGENVYWALYCFVTWINECYQFNGARMFGAQPNFPAVDRRASLVAMSVLPAIRGRPGDLTAYLPVVLEIPPLEWLANRNPEEMISARLEEGKSFLEKVGEWQNSPKEDTAGNVRLAAKAFESRLNRIARGEDAPRGKMVSILSAKFELPPVKPCLQLLAGGAALGSAGVAAMGGSLSWFLASLAGGIYALSNSGNSLHRWFATRPGKETIRYRRFQYRDSDGIWRFGVTAPHENG